MIFSRIDGKPFKILARGDCTSRRSVRMNADLFPNGVEFVQNEKSPFIFFLDALEGKSSTREKLEAISDVAAMPRTLGIFYLGQADRTILSEQDADLIILDTWGDLNFDIWQSRAEGWKCWIHPKFLKEPDRFYAEFQKLGKRTLNESVDNAVQLSAALRQKNPNADVLLLNQQLEYYPKMDARMGYYEFGGMVAAKVDRAFFGGVVAKDDLELDDIGSCGPGLTLHFQPATYRRMFEKAFAAGLLSGAEPQPSVPTQSPEHAASVDVVETEIQPVEAAPVAATVVDLGFGSPTCHAGCPAPDHVQKKIGNYIGFGGLDSRWEPAVIAIADLDDYAAWEQAVKKRYDRVRMKNRAIKAGYFTHPFRPMLHTIDRHDIHHSMETRSGGAMRAAYTKSVEEMGGAPTQRLDVRPPKCMEHWSLSFGVFQPEPGYTQGAVQVDERLVGYVSANRIGDLLLYSVIFGHGEHLDRGIMYLLHFDIVRWVSENLDGQAKGLKYIMYGGVPNGGPGLWQWKRTVGFKAAKLFAEA